MTDTDTGTSRKAPPTATFTSRDPATGRPLADHPVHGPEDVAPAVERGRAAGARWAADRKSVV